MTDSDILKLIQKNIDGELSPDEKIQLQEYLANDEFAIKTYENMNETAQILDQVELLDPPKNLVKRVMTVIDRKKYNQHVSEKTSVFDFLIDIIATRKQWAIAFATGFIIAALMFTFFIRKESPAEYDVMGSIGIDHDAALEFKQSTVLNSANSSVIFNLSQGPGILQIIIDCKTDKICQIDLRFSSGTIHLSDYKPTVNSSVQLKTHSDGISLSTETNNQFSFTFTGKINTGYLETGLRVENGPEVKEKIILN